MSSELMRAETAHQPEALARFVERFGEHVSRCAEPAYALRHRHWHNLSSDQRKEKTTQMNRTRVKRTVPALFALAVSVLLVACGGGNDKTTSSSASTGAASSGGKAATIGLLLPETKTARYEAHDRPTFQAKVKQLCPNCKQLYQNASQDAQKQLTQAEAMLASGADVLVLDAVDVGSVGPIIKEAN